ncbi:MAG: hypothetical protein BWY05_00531 [Euryarchaeota archaeon ADurb.Bin165]|nr:MAG: hypothetical protein BWY05_00531 [Euryarchaeota archaeon ADurb.Bin165]
MDTGTGTGVDEVCGVWTGAGAEFWLLTVMAAGVTSTETGSPASSVISVMIMFKLVSPLETPSILSVHSWTCSAPGSTFMLRSTVEIKVDSPGVPSTTLTAAQSGIVTPDTRAIPDGLKEVKNL